MATSEAALKEAIESNGCVFVKRFTVVGGTRSGTNHHRVRTYVEFICSCQKDLPDDQRVITKKEADKALKVCQCRSCGNKKREATCQDRYGVSHYTDVINGKND